MSSADYESITTARDIRTHDYLHILGVSCLFYDHAITLGQEINYVWRSPKNRSAYWFFANRYLAFWGNIAVVVLGFTTLSSKVCSRYNIFRQLLLVVNQVVVCILLTLRIYALYDRSLRILTYLAGSGAVLAVVAIWTLFGQKGAPSQKASGCHIGFPLGTSIRSAAAWEALFVYDSIVFGLTIFKTWKARRDHAITGISIPLISLILRDGSIYFAVMALCNLANIMTYYFAGPFLRGCLSTFASGMSATMMSRLMLNLHRTAELGIMSTTQTTDSNVFTSVNWTDTLDIASPESVAYDLGNDRRLSQSRRYPARQ